MLLLSLWIRVLSSTARTSLFLSTRSSTHGFCVGRIIARLAASACCSAVAGLQPEAPWGDTHFIRLVLSRKWVIGTTIKELS